MLDRIQQCQAWLHQVTGQSLTLQAMNNDASFRRYFRTQWQEKDYVVMDAPPTHENVAPFINIAQRLSHAGLNVPQIIAEDREQGFLLLSDLGHDLYLPTLKQGEQQKVEDLYSDALRALVHMQKHTSTEDLPPYDAELLEREMALFPDWFVKQHLQIRLSDTETNRLNNSFALLTDNALAQPQVFVHRDYHSRNLLIAEKNPGILDFQDAVLGAVTYDLVSLLRDAYIQWPLEKIHAWALQYQSLALEADIIKETDETVFLRWFDWMGLQRHIKVAGIFARLYHRDGKAGYLQDIPLVLNYIIEVAETYPEMQDLATLVTRLAKHH